MVTGMDDRLRSRSPSPTATIERIPAATKVWAAGTKGSPLGATLAEGAGATSTAGRPGAGRTPTARSRAIPRSSSSGDLMALDDLPGVAEVAMQSGAHAAHTIRRRLKGNDVMRPFHYHDLGTLAVISRFRAVAKVGPVARSGGFIGWLLWLVVHITFLTGFKNRFGALARWAVSFVGRGRYERALIGRWTPRARTLRRICLRFGTDRRRHSGGQTMPITVTPIEGLSDHINDIRIRTARIVNEEILPNESALWTRGAAT